MGFIFLLALSTLAVAGSAAFFSVYGLAQIFSASFIAVVIMGGSLEVGKIVAASYLYRFWDVTPKLLKVYLFVAVFTLMVVTSLGIFGFLTAAYQTDSIGLKQQQGQIVLYENQKAAATARLDGINADVARTADNYITKRIELIQTQKAEKDQLISDIAEYDAKLLELKTNVLTTEAKIGPIIYVAEVLDENPDKATFWFVLIIIGVFDPLAVALTLATNIAMRKRKDEKALTKEEVQEVVEHIVDHIADEVVDHRIPPVVATSAPPIPPEPIPVDEFDGGDLILTSGDPADAEKLTQAVGEISDELQHGGHKSDSWLSRITGSHSNRKKRTSI